MKMQRKVTMAEVGRTAGGYHPSTVSLALRNHPEISKRVQRLIQKTAKKMGYRRDPLLDAFNRHRTQGLVRKAKPVIAFVSDFSSKDSLEASAAHWALWKSGNATARKLHHQLEFFPLQGENMTTKRLDAVLHARGVEGVVVGAMHTVAAPLDFTWDRYSTVMIETDWLGSLGHSVEAAFLDGARIAFKRMLAQGYQHIGLVEISDKHPKRSQFIRAGILCEQTRQPGGLKIPPLTLSGESSPAEVRRWLYRYQVDSVIADPSAYKQLSSLAGRSHLCNIGWACTDTIDAPSNVAGIEVNYGALGAVAIEQVVSLMRVNQRGTPLEASTTFVPVSWREGSNL